MADSAIIFDVDGVLLHLSHDEEELFFTALSRFVPTHDLSRDWNNYRIRNDAEIVTEIMERNGLPPSVGAEAKAHYLSLLQEDLAADRVRSEIIPGADELLIAFQSRARLGIATANFQAAARLRLEQAGLWSFVRERAEGADGGGHKHAILERVVERLDVPRDRIVYVGDNLNDLEAGSRAGVHFIGFSTDASRVSNLQAHGARWTAQDHMTTRSIINQILFSKVSVLS
jgi:phosphoglycolate phosphatase-like HAD superfamily hydrolase